MKTVALDFDGVINSYTSGFDENRIPDPPVEGALDFIRRMQDAGWRVAIHSTRCERQVGIAMIRWYLTAHGLEAERVGKILTVPHKPMAKLYIDDRGFRFTGQWPSVQEVEHLGENPGQSASGDGIPGFHEAVQQVPSDPVHHWSPTDGEGEKKCYGYSTAGWYYWSGDFADVQGPFDSEEAAREQREFDYLLAKESERL